MVQISHLTFLLSNYLYIYIYIYIYYILNFIGWKIITITQVGLSPGNPVPNKNKKFWAKQTCMVVLNKHWNWLKKFRAIYDWFRRLWFSDKKVQEKASLGYQKQAFIELAPGMRYFVCNQYIYYDQTFKKQKKKTFLFQLLLDDIRHKPCSLSLSISCTHIFYSWST